MKTLSRMLSVSVAAVSFFTFGLSAADQKPLTPEKWKLAWSEEFDKDGKIDPEKWTSEKGYLRNGEPQYYSENNVEVKDGSLVITARKEKDGATDYKFHKNTCNLTSGSIFSKYIFGFGRYEIRAKFNIVPRVWPALWLMGKEIKTPELRRTWPYCGELDIMEYFGPVTDKIPSHIEATCHFGKPGGKGHAAGGGGQKSSPTLDNEWHTYSIEWNRNTICYYFDGKQINYKPFDVSKAEADGYNPFIDGAGTYCIKINLAFRNSGKPLKDINVDGTKFLVDYVRYYTPVEEEKK